MRAEVFGMVGWVSRMAEGEVREAHLIRRTKSAERVVDVWPSWARACLGVGRCRRIGRCRCVCLG